MPAIKNTVVIFREDPGQGWVEEKHMEVVHKDFDPDTVEIKPENVLVKTLFLSLDPYMRMRMATGAKSYIHPFQIGEPLQGTAVAEVYRAAEGSKLQKGDLVVGMVDWAEWTIVSEKGLTKVEKKADVPLSYFLGILGMPGYTAYAGLEKIGEPKAGETVYVSGAAGAVGLVVGQIAKAKGCRVIGSAGSDDKVKLLLEEANFDAAFNYKTVKSYTDALKEHCPKGIDVYWDNVGGEMLDAVLPLMNAHGRIPVCGAISQYNASEPYGVKNLSMLIKSKLKLQGFIVGDYYADRELYQRFQQEIVQWIKEKKIVYKEHVDEGIASAPSAFVGMLKGRNTGKQIVKVV
ncbi:NADP-dependent alkenal double bond reductase P2 [Fimicolochytrium jonesii]|uniref:NADP-dependent alkenal double bond reductase P2 n=1 Tax=Fimicolochytrium jonesii TaxID=1396493 RepID=UPI0022FEDF7F|nr:NADP-dependent alkenal double bond reductase P2 [Fimicolochytrium jonesii]KAI8824444.1 NADP-dependent alkenal double bond reductase P2 [Fimicolochytrium jonesii]